MIECMVGVRGDVFDALAQNHAMRVAAEIAELALIAQACDEYTVDESRADIAAERLIRGGADGTAHIGEFLALELAGPLEISSATAALRIRETLDLRDRHPELWAHALAGGIAPWQAVKVAARCSAAGLDASAARWVDHQLCAAWTALPWARVSRSLEGLIVKADTALAAERAREHAADRSVFVGDHRDGASVLYARLHTEDALALDATIADLANALAARGDTTPIRQRRATALGLLADPRAALDLLTGHGDGRPTNRAATVTIHIAAENASGAGVARVEGVGALEADALRRFLADSHVTIRPVIDLNAPPTVDAYEIPDQLRRHVIARNPHEVFPFSSRPTTGLDLDHTLPYSRHPPPGAGQTRADNLGPLSRRTHRAKTAGLWIVHQPEAGTFCWTSPHGFQYAVTPHGTTALGRLR